MRMALPSVSSARSGYCQWSRISVTRQVMPQLEMLDALRLQAQARRRMVEAKPGDDTATRLAHPFDSKPIRGQ